MILVSLLASFIGSWHCALMCGPIAANFKTRNGLVSYQLGRLLAYCSLGFISGLLGSFLLREQFTYARIFLGVLFGLVLIQSAFQQLKTQNSQTFFSSFLAKIYLVILRKLKQFKIFQLPMLAGVLTGFLPCAWLFTWLMAAANSHDPVLGVLLMFILWLGGVPTLSVISIFIRRGHQLSSPLQKKILFFVLLISGVYSIASHLIFGLGKF